MEKILRVWLEHPELRLGQLLVNARSRMPGTNRLEIVHIEDMPLTQAVEELHEWMVVTKVMGS